MRSTTNPIASDRTLITFQLTLPCGRDTNSGICILALNNFNSRVQCGVRPDISISTILRRSNFNSRTLRGMRPNTCHFGGLRAIFQLTHPIRGTVSMRCSLLGRVIFQLTHPVWECDGVANLPQIMQAPFQLTHPCRVRRDIANVDDIRGISIPAPREGCDFLSFGSCHP